MTPRDFAYWLQGPYEIHPPTGTMTATQKAVILAHVKMSEETSGVFNTALVEFRTWVKTALEFNATHEQISAKLSDLFEHVIK
jgi:hypothetical protein